jgi:hypothetical protein
MKTSITWKFRSLAGKMMIGLLLAAMIGSIGVVSAFAKDNRRGDDRRRDVHRRGDYRPYGQYGHRERNYYPQPPVVFAPPPPPGITIFFPPIFIRP